MFPVQVDVRPLCLSASDVEVPPPICVRGKRVSRVFIQAIVELVLDESDCNSDHEKYRPVGFEYGKKLAGQHVEIELALGELKMEGKVEVNGFCGLKMESLRSTNRFLHA